MNKAVAPVLSLEQVLFFFTLYFSDFCRIRKYIFRPSL